MPPGPPVPPFAIEALIPVADGAAVAVRAGGRTLGRVDPAVPAELGLRVGTIVGMGLWSDLQAAISRRGAFDRGVHLLAIRARSVAAVQRRLSAAFGVDAAQHAIERLSPYLDDRAFARAWVEERQRTRPLGAAALLAGLRREGVPNAIAKGVVAASAPAAAESDLACRAAAARLARMRNVPRDRLRMRLWAYLARRGFPGAAISAALRQVLDAPAENQDDGP